MKQTLITTMLYSFIDKAIEKEISKHSSKEKTCLLCGVKHHHNNSFCSAECCKKYNEIKRIK